MIISPENKGYLPWVFLGAAILSIGFAMSVFDTPQMRWQVAFGLVSSCAAFTYFLYSRHLEETRMFRDLFFTFNERYDKLNGRLNELVMKPDTGLLTPEDKRLLYDYFNLCAEEFYFFRLGYIPVEVWSSWRNGMLFFLKTPRVRELLTEDLTTNSYYGLTVEKIESGER